MAEGGEPKFDGNIHDNTQLREINMKIEQFETNINIQQSYLILNLVKNFCTCHLLTESQ